MDCFKSGRELFVDPVVVAALAGLDGVTDDEAPKKSNPSSDSPGLPPFALVLSCCRGRGGADACDAAEGLELLFVLL